MYYLAVGGVRGAAMNWFDSYIDRQVDRSFRKMADGTLVYLPWGRGRGYVVTSDERYRRLRQFTRSMATVGTLAPFMGTSVAFLPLRITLPFFVLCALGGSVVFMICIRRLAGDLPRTAEVFRLPDWRERMRLVASDSARLYGATRLRVILAVSTLFALMCIYAVVALPEMRLQAVGLGMLSAAAVVWTRYELRVLREEDEAERSKRPPRID